MQSLLSVSLTQEGLKAIFAIFYLPNIWTSKITVYLSLNTYSIPFFFEDYFMSMSYVLQKYEWPSMLFLSGYPNFFISREFLDTLTVQSIKCMKGLCHQSSSIQSLYGENRTLFFPTRSLLDSRFFNASHLFCGAFLIADKDLLLLSDHQCFVLIVNFVSYVR